MNRDIPMNRRRRTVDVELVILLVALILLSIAAQWVNRNLNLSETELPAEELRVTPASLSDSFINGDGGTPRTQPGPLSVKEAD